MKTSTLLKISLSTGIILSSLLTTSALAITANSARQTISALYQDFSHSTVPINTFMSQFDPNFVMHSNGETLNYGKFKTHVEYIRQHFSQPKFKLLKIVANQNTIADIHTVSGTTNGKTSELKFFTFTTFNQSGKIIQLDEISIPMTKDSDNSIGTHT